MTRHLRRPMAVLALIAVLTSALWLFAAPPAQACSCEQMTSSSIERADAGFAGTIVDISSIPSQWADQERFVATVQVTTDLKDNLSDEIYVTSYRDDGGNCGVTWSTGNQIAAAIYEIDGVLNSDSCSEIPAPLAASWQPAKTVGGTATLLIGGYGPNRLVAYDSGGMPIAYAFEPGELRAFSVCPGGQAVLEVVSPADGGATIDTRSLATFEVTASIPAVLGEEPFGVWNVRCDAVDGSAAAISGYESDVYELSNGVFALAGDLLVADRFDAQNFWPRLETDSTASIVGQEWMQQAAELDPPVAIAASDRGTEVRQLGAGEAFGLDEDTQDEVAQDDEPQDAATPDEVAQRESPVRREPGATDGTPWWMWLLALSAVVGAVALVSTLARRS